MKSAWGPEIYDTSAWNAAQVEEINLLDFDEMLLNDIDTLEWDKTLSD